MRVCQELPGRHRPLPQTRPRQNRCRTRPCQNPRPSRTAASFADPNTYFCSTHHEDWWLEDGVDSIAQIGTTSSGQVGSKTKCGQSYADVSQLQLLVPKMCPTNHRPSKMSIIVRHLEKEEQKMPPIFFLTSRFQVLQGMFVQSFAQIFEELTA